VSDPRIIELRGIDRYFSVGDETVHALDEVDLDIAAGEYVAIMGPSGSGKSTLLNVLGLLDKPTAGTYKLDQRDTSNMDDDELADTRHSKIGFVFQFFHLVPRLSAFENAELPLILDGMPARERRERVEQILAELGLKDRMQHRPDQLSGGQRQRVAIARAMVTRPKVLLADEPTGNLDSVSGTECIQILEALNADGLTLLVVTHDSEIGDRARRILRMQDGRIVKDLRG